MVSFCFGLVFVTLWERYPSDTSYSVTPATAQAVSTHSLLSNKFKVVRTSGGVKISTWWVMKRYALQGRSDSFLCKLHWVVFSNLLLFTVPWQAIGDTQPGRPARLLLWADVSCSSEVWNTASGCPRSRSFLIPTDLSVHFHWAF